MSKIRRGETELSLSKEQALSEIVCKTHPHKEHPANMRVKSFIIREGWGFFKSLCNRKEVYNG